MADQLKTTFIPKQSAAPAAMSQAPIASSAGRTRARASISILTILAVLAFFAALISIGGVFLFENTLTQRIAQMNQQLGEAEKQFEPTFIEELRALDHRLNVANDVLRNHRGMSAVFKLLDETTLKTLQYDSFEVDFNEGTTAHITGRARSYQAIAQQSAAFSAERHFTNHIFSELVLLDTGRVQFELVLALSPEITSFEKSYALFNPSLTNFDMPTESEEEVEAENNTTGLPV